MLARYFNLQCCIWCIFDSFKIRSKGPVSTPIDYTVNVMLAAFIDRTFLDSLETFFFKSLSHGEVYKYSYFDGALSTTDEPDLRK